MTIRRPGRESQAGQAAVESAIIMPMMFFLVLGVIQLGMLQHARLMTEYAAYNAVRAGIVWNGNQCMMRRAAVVSLLPTLAATDTLFSTEESFGKSRPGLLKTWAMAEILVAGTAAVGSILDWIGIGDPGVRLVDVQILNPTEDDLGLFKEGKELDFDAVAGVPNGPDFTSEPEMRRASVLTARVTFLYPMRIPFANWTIFYSYLAQRAGFSASGGFFKPGLEPNTIVTGSMIDTNVSGAIAAGMGGDLTGLDDEVLVATQLMIALWVLGRSTGIYLFPLHASHSMRMQSNFYASSFDAAGLCTDI